MDLPSGVARYQLLDRLGLGATGEVWRARDRALDRMVALKFLRGGDPDEEGRLLLEAQRQARVVHPGVCAVYEAGRMEGRAYIAMAWIAGPSLARAPRPDPATAAAWMAEVAEGVHAAHMAGLVHRDLKPGNILLQPRTEGGWQPVVADFGLAREVDPGSRSASLGTVGTPAYMAPEQVLGERPADVRTDVYGLGATLYALLAGRPPFEGPSDSDSLPVPQALEVLRRVLDGRPRPLRELNPSVSKPLALIVDTCMAATPEARYPTARALAEDLRRCLAGQPLQARPPTWPARVRAWAKRRPALAAAGAAGLGGLLLAGGTFAGIARRTRAQAAAAQTFGLRLQDCEQRLRLIHLSPRHDIRAQVEGVRARVAEVRREVAAAGLEGQGVGVYVLGRAHLLLGDLEGARRELDRAWALGFREPACAQARGLALLRLYQRGLDAQWRLPVEAREAHLATLEQEYRAPAQALLAGAETEELRAAWAWLEGREAEALAWAARAAQAAPWAVEPLLLQHRIWRYRHREARRKGDGEAQGRVKEAAGLLLARALEVGKSDPAVGVAAAAWALEAHHSGGPEDRVTEAGCREALVACEGALAADPDHAPARLLRAEIQARLALHRPEDLRFTSPAWEGALADARAAAALEGRRAEALAYLAHLLVQRARWRFKTGGDAAPDLAAAVAASAEALRLDPAAPGVLSTLGSLGRFHASLAKATGQDPRPFLAEAVAAERRHRARRAQEPSAARALVLALLTQAEAQAQGGEDPSGALNEAGRLLEGLPPEPSTAVLQVTRAGTAAEAALLVGRDPGPALAEARRLLSSWPEGQADTWAERAWVACLAARGAGNPRAALAEGEAALDRYRRLGARPTTKLRLEAEWAYAALRLPGAEGARAARRGLAAVQALARLRPREPRAQALEGVFRARLQGAAAGRPALEAALSRDLLLRREFGPWLEGH
ncbi:MAG: serine/threonine protein kinase [Acidobacteria bacterium]|nr:serine/threonine protein kinase [Acidobacteriota bacterium]